jgi:hypothetical protein
MAEPDFDSEIADLRQKLLEWVVGELTTHVDARGIGALPAKLAEAIERKADEALGAALGRLELPNPEFLAEKTMQTLTSNESALARTAFELSQKIERLIEANGEQQRRIEGQEAALAQQAAALDHVLQELARGGAFTVPIGPVIAPPNEGEKQPASGIVELASAPVAGEKSIGNAARPDAHRNGEEPRGFFARLLEAIQRQARVILGLIACLLVGLVIFASCARQNEPKWSEREVVPAAVAPFDAPTDIANPDASSANPVVSEPAAETSDGQVPAGGAAGSGNGAPVMLPPTDPGVAPVGPVPDEGQP